MRVESLTWPSGRAGPGLSYIEVLDSYSGCLVPGHKCPSFFMMSGPDQKTKLGRRVAKTSRMLVGLNLIEEVKTADMSEICLHILGGFGSFGEMDLVNDRHAFDRTDPI